MAKQFNITGTCIPSMHYMADTSAKMNRVMAMVEKGEYFIIKRPRQYGKTTILYLLTSMLNKQEEYIAIKSSFEGIADKEFLHQQTFSPSFLRQLAIGIKQTYPELSDWIYNQSVEIDSLEKLSEFISALVKKAGKKIVILIDEVDKSSNHELFLSFLAMMRAKYLLRAENMGATFHAVVLAGVHDVKNLKLKLRPGEEAKYNSPWNIAADFEVDLSLFPNEIMPMLEDYSQEQGVTMDITAIAERLFYYTSGYPFLVSALCKITDEKILPLKNERIWRVEDIETAADMLIKSERSNTNFDSLVKNLENNEALYNLVYRLVIENTPFPFNVHDPITDIGITYGIFRSGQGLNIHNRIYREVIVNYMTSKLLTSGKTLEIEIAAPYTLYDGGLNAERVLLKFQEYMREQHSEKDGAFLERHGRLVFLAFLKPILNGKGYAFKEPEISEERRLDIAITFSNKKYVIELKTWRGDSAHETGLFQLADYLDRQNLDTGFLVIFDHRKKEKTWENKWESVQEKRIFVVWV